MDNKYRFGVIDSPPDERDHIVKFDVADVDMLSAPASFRAKTIPKYPKYQRSNDCVACALSSILECFLKAQTGRWYTLSSGFIYGNKDYTTTQAPGMVIRDALRFVNHDGDVRVQEFDGRQFDYPEIVDYVAANRDWLTPRAMPQAITEYIRADVEIANEFKLGLAKYQYAIVSIPIFADDSILHDVYVHNSDEIVGRHAIMVYGYNDKGYLMLNSWGKNWGENGHAILPYNHPINEAWYILPNNSLGQFYSDGNDSYKPQVPAYGMQWDDVPNRAFEGEADTAPEPPKPVEPEKPVEPPTVPTGKRIICIDAGHCDKFPGASYKNGLQKEEVDNLHMALAVEKHLVSFGHTVYQIRKTGMYLNPKNKDTNLNARPTYANKVKADYFISIHRNSLNSGSTGIETWVHSKANDNTVKIAQAIQSEVCGVAPCLNRGVKKGFTSDPKLDYAVNRISTMPSCLLELLFISNPENNAQYNRYFEQYAKAVAVGLCKGMGWNYTAVEPPKPVEKLYRVRIGDFEGTKMIEIGRALAHFLKLGVAYNGGLKEYEKGKWRIDCSPYVGEKGLASANKLVNALGLLGLCGVVQEM